MKRKKEEEKETGYEAQEGKTNKQTNKRKKSVKDLEKITIIPPHNCVSPNILKHFV